MTIEQFRTMLHHPQFDLAELNADDQQALLNMFQAARQTQSSGGGAFLVQARLFD